MPSAPLPSLRQISLSDLATLAAPETRIKTDYDVAAWRKTQGYSDLLLFVHRLNEASVGCSLPWESGVSEPIQRTIDMLEELESWIADIPPQHSPQRFGNLAFRRWGARLEERAEEVLRKLLQNRVDDIYVDHLVRQLRPHLITSFGSFGRIDYGTGHEASWTLFTLSLALVRFYEVPHAEYPSLSPTERPPSVPYSGVERELALALFPRYLRLVWALQDTYRLEPAGSHGVWGLDDFCMIPYLFGSAQVRDSDIPPSSILRPNLPPTSLYNLAINRIRATKSGPFHEHSSQLFDIAQGVRGWTKVNQGMGKMWEAEVLGKRVVVQHLALGGLIEWDTDADSSDDAPSDGVAALSAANSTSSGTATPWTMTSAPTSAPWAGGPAASRNAPPVPGPGLGAPWAAPSSVHHSPGWGTAAPWVTSAPFAGQARSPGRAAAGMPPPPVPPKTLF